MPTEYDNIDLIGTTHENFNNSVEKYMNNYYHKQEVSTVKNLLAKMNVVNHDSIVDLGCSVGTWYKDFKKMNFKIITGIDISEQRAKIAQKRGYNQIHICNAYELPFENKSQKCVISNDVLIHVIQDDDVIKILEEVYRVLIDNGVFIFNFANLNGLSTKTNKKDYCKFRTLENFQKMIYNTNFKIKFIIPSYFAIPRIFANSKIVIFSTKIIFPVIDKILKFLNFTESAKVIYFGLQK